MQALKHLQLVGEEITGQAGIYALDPSKLVISGKRAGIPGLEIQSYVREKHRMELEMAAGSYALGISTVMDTREGFERLFQALKALDEVLGRSGHAAAGGPSKAGGLFENGRKKTEGECCNTLKRYAVFQRQRHRSLRSSLLRWRQGASAVSIFICIRREFRWSLPVNA